MKETIRRLYIGAAIACICLGVLCRARIGGADAGTAGNMTGKSLETSSQKDKSEKEAQDGENTAQNGENTAQDEENTAEDGENTAPRIAITFDDGPHDGTTKKLLDGLKERGVKASFFLIGSEIEGREDIVRRMAKEGHLIGNHTWSHVQLTDLSDAEACSELERTNRAIREATGETPEFMRPPFGTISERVEAAADQIPVLWSVDSLDWTTSNSDEITDRVVTQAEDGAIILLHDCYASSVDAALRIVDLLTAKGYAFVTADELITD